MASQQSEKVPSPAVRGPAVRVDRLTKHYGALPALRDVTLEIQWGEVVGLVGPNGAGKTTLLMTLAGFLRPQQGTVVVNGQNVRCGSTLQHIAFVPDRPVYYGFLTAREHLGFVQRISGRNNQADGVEAALRRVGLSADADRKVGRFSRGMAQRLAWAQALVTSPAVFLLDEPMAGLDPASVIAFREFVAEVRQKGAAVLLSSHSLAEVERQCDRVLFLMHGKLSHLESVTDSETRRFEVRLAKGSSPDLSCLETFAKGIVRQGGCLQFCLLEDLSLTEIVQRLENCGVRVAGITEVSSTLEDSFLRKLGEPNWRD